MTQQGKKYDSGKADWSLLPLSELEPVIRVLGHGAGKYGRENWKYVDDAERRYFSAAMRHLAAWQDGETADGETGISHLAHAACNLIFLLHFGNDDLTSEAVHDKMVLTSTRNATT